METVNRVVNRIVGNSIGTTWVWLEATLHG